MLSTALIHDYLFRRTKRKRRSNGDSFDEGDVSDSYEEEEDNAHNHHLDDSGIGRYVEQLQYLVSQYPKGSQLCNNIGLTHIVLLKRLMIRWY